MDRNEAGRVNIVQTGRRTMYAMMGAGAYGCSGITPPLAAHLLPRTIYCLEVFQLSGKDISQLEQLQRSILRRILNLPVNAPIDIESRQRFNAESTLSALLELFLVSMSDYTNFYYYCTFLSYLLQLVFFCLDGAV